MQQWRIDFWADTDNKGPIEKWLDRLTHEQLASVSKELAMLAGLGNELRLPHSRALGAGLFELRERKFGYRLYYAFFQNRLIVVLATGDKNSQTRDIHVARERLSLLKEKNEN